MSLQARLPGLYVHFCEATLLYLWKQHIHHLIQTVP